MLEVDLVADVPELIKSKVEYPPELLKGRELLAYNTIKAKLTEINKGEISSTIINCYAIVQALRSIAYDDKNGRYHTITKDGEFIPYKQIDIVKFYPRTCGFILNNEELELMISGEKEQDKKQIRNIGIMAVLDELRVSQHISIADNRVDMFVKQASLKYKGDGEYLITRAHVPFNVMNPIDDLVIDDYKIHFPALDEFLKLVLASRFAPDRKKAFLWLHATTDWGKGFLMNALKESGLVVDITVKLVESIMEGKPAPLQASDFSRAWVLCVNEFKSVKSEIKELESEILLAPKNKMMQKAQLYTKVFASADGVESLTGDNGVESQFANRFSYFKFEGNLEDRLLFQSVGSDMYFKSVSVYIAAWLNKAVGEMIKLGEERARKKSTAYIKAFHNEYGISKSFGDVKDNITDIVEDFLSYCLFIGQVKTIQKRTYDSLEEEKFSKYIFKQYGTNGLILTSPKKAYDDWVDSTYSNSQKAGIRKMKNKIFDLMPSIKKYQVQKGTVSMRKNGILLEGTN